MNIKEEIQINAAKAFFAIAWADLQEENKESHSMSQLDIIDIMPEKVDPAAISASKCLIKEVEELNKLSIEKLMKKAKENEGGDRPCTPEYFGHYLAMHAMGTGVGMESVTNEKIRVPYFEFSQYDLDKEYEPFKR